MCLGVRSFSLTIQVKRLHRCKPSVRRVKCDETKPDCLRCVSTGRKCDGYLPVERAVDNSVLTTSASSSSGIRLACNPSIEILGDEKERRYFHFFCSRTAPQLAGFFDSNFWCRLLLQTTLCEPAVRHAVIALASTHERFEVDGSVLSRNDETFDGEFALRHYNQAINHLIKPIRTQGKQAADVCLISCLLFACFEVSPSPSQSSLEQLQNSCSKLIRRNRLFEDIMARLFPISEAGSRYYQKFNHLKSTSNLTVMS